MPAAEPLPTHPSSRQRPVTVDTGELTALARQFADVAATVAAGSRRLHHLPAPGTFGSGEEGRRRYASARASLARTVETLQNALARHGDSLRRHADVCERAEDDNLAAAHRLRTALEAPS